ncbi:hypothetical protein SmJEL517_g00122 [Synchytrium microbalum]|uniref:NADP-dependent oxidoreductase domain-containing protein n=1 Tax=Synchytrium microbalum TaxID=1806994 RepID=A0A507CEN6_9FUNG|nr:uncharacterized protein SmJEL517_g00122 [Synchytrium microbalum]TPX38092.1 hypothetical protein SmJEL517_g00122 [Synchytrium microbalum]
MAVNSTDAPTGEYVRLGNTGMLVSRICLGCMSYGSSKWSPWVLDEDESLPLLELAWKKGINFWDTADVYSNGESEILVGKAIKKFNIPRDQLVLATKCYSPTLEGQPGVYSIGKPFDQPPYVNKAGLSRKHIFDACNDSLRRLGVDYIDLYQIHRFDYATPVEETMEALNDLVRMGKVRYIGASSMYAWQFAKCQSIAKSRGWAQFVTMQNFYNLLYREEEREMIPTCIDQSVGLIPWSPLARGLLTGKGKTVRSDTDVAFKRWFGKMDAGDTEIINRVKEVAEKKGVTSSQVALAWLYTKNGVCSPIVGINKPQYFDDLLAAQKLKLTSEEVKYLEEPYVPHPITGHL